MTKFEKLADQFAAAGEIIAIEEVEKGIEALRDDGMSDIARTARLMRMLGIAAQKAPDACKKLVAIEKDIMADEVDALPDGELVKSLTNAFMQSVIPFFTSSAGQDAKR